MTFRLALLGALRHWRRSLMVMVAVAVACMVMVTIGSVLNGVSESFYVGLATGAGHVRLRSAAAASATDPTGLEALVPDAQALARRILESGGGDALAAEPVLGFAALLVEKSPNADIGNPGAGAVAETGAAAEPRNLPMLGSGVLPDTRFAQGARGGLKSGAFLPGGRGICVSEAAARLLRLRLGDGVLVLVRDRNAQPWYEELPVMGLFATESVDFDETNFYIDYDRAAEMLDVEGSAREIRVLLKDRALAPTFAAKLSKILAGDAAGTGGSAGSAGTAGEPVPASALDLEIRDWRSINASMLSLLVIIKVLLGFMMFLFALVAGTIVTNTVLMSVMERMREFGTMRAIGLRARQLRRLILLEGAMLGVAGAAFGLALGAAAVGALSGGGIDLGGLMENIGLSRWNRPAPSLSWYAFCAAVSVLVSAAATARAARSATRAGVAESLSSVR